MRFKQTLRTPTTNLRFEHKLSINNHRFRLAIARGEKEKEVGLGHFDLPKDHGMIFHDRYDLRRDFWMKNCIVPLDIIFIDSNMVIQKICTLPNVPLNTPDLHIPRCSSGIPVRLVLELYGGTCKKCSIRPGDKVDVRVRKRPKV